MHRRCERCPCGPPRSVRIERERRRGRSRADTETQLVLRGEVRGDRIQRSQEGVGRRVDRRNLAERVARTGVRPEANPMDAQFRTRRTRCEVGRRGRRVARSRGDDHDDRAHIRCRDGHDGRQCARPVPCPAGLKPSESGQRRAGPDRRCGDDPRRTGSDDDGQGGVEPQDPLGRRALLGREGTGGGSAVCVEQNRDGRTVLGNPVDTCAQRRRRRGNREVRGQILVLAHAHREHDCCRDIRE